MGIGISHKPNYDGKFRHFKNNNQDNQPDLLSEWVSHDYNIIVAFFFKVKCNSYSIDRNMKQLTLLQITVNIAFLIIFNEDNCSAFENNEVQFNINLYFLFPISYSLFPVKQKSKK